MFEIAGVPEEAAKEALRLAMGMKYRHYAPKAKLMIVEGDLREEIFAIRQLAYKAYKEGRKVEMCIRDSLRSPSNAFP